VGPTNRNDTLEDSFRIPLGSSNEHVSKAFLDKLYEHSINLVSIVKFVGDIVIGVGLPLVKRLYVFVIAYIDRIKINSN